ncbi:sodium-coupled monocarboxylate transporter 1-like [Acanthaster planci]|uniref:Sodium-coupled monocarboxylate transporter 1-like n=1 Tax=Acanthaster planci TaxID=133434 RepID=A0A8B7XS27_ACAPL|nr:sodium-coupled monocarboxylate transporter 1-like [Acanthaster planci]
MDGVFGSRSYFQAADYIVCGVMLLASVAIGVYYGVKGGGQRNSSSYVLADRSMTVAPVTLSLTASLFSGIALQGIPADAYFHGPVFFWASVPITSSVILSLAFFMPMFYRLGMASSYEYLELRFNYAVKICGVLSFLLFAVLYTGVVTYLASVAANTVTGIRVEVAIVSLCVVCGIYTVIGGIKAVLWTDSLQMLLMLTSTVAIIIKVSVENGFENIWTIASEGSRTNLLHFNGDLTDFYNGWAFVTSTTFAGFVITNQYMVQRLVVCKSEAVARASLISFFVITVLYVIVLVFTGICIYAYYDGCDPHTLGYITKSDQIVPFFITDVFSNRPGVPGLLLAGLFGAALSTLSSALNAIATLVGEHFIKPAFNNLNDLTFTVILKSIVVAASALALGMSFLIPAIGDAIPVLLTVTACTTGCLFAIYFLAGFFPFCGSKGALSGFVVGLIVALTMSVGCIVYQVPPDNLPLSADRCLNETDTNYNETVSSPKDERSWFNSTVTPSMMTTNSDSSRSEIPVIFSLAKSWLSCLSFLTTMAVALLVTLVTGKNDTSNMDPRLVIWKIKNSKSSKPQRRVRTGYKAVPEMECENICNSSEAIGSTPEDKQLMERITSI